MLLLIVSTPALLSFAAAPFGQWYLAWIAIAPLLIAISHATSAPSAACIGLIAGLFYFSTNIWWLWTASIPGTIVLIIYFSLYWAGLAAIVRGLGLLRLPVFANGGPSDRESHRANLRRGVWMSLKLLTIASLWVSVEWFRCYSLWGFHWVPIGATQAPVVALCQVADFGGPWAVSFYLMLCNALIAFAWLERQHLQALGIPAALVASVVLFVIVYGMWRLNTTLTVPGPRVMVLQTNFEHRPGGALNVERNEVVEYCLSELDKALAQHSADLAILPESVLPPINDDARRELAQSPVGTFLDSTHRRLLAISKQHNAAVLVGGTAVTGWTSRDRERVGSEIRNSAYFIDPAANVAISRYDKIYLVPFSERVPFMDGPTWVRRIVAILAASRAAQPMHAGDMKQFVPFMLTWKDALAHFQEGPSNDSSPEARTNRLRNTFFIAPICLENIDPAVVARMIRGKHEIKQAEFIANLSNDGWFAPLERHQHLQTTVFRCIENRVPMARSSNTGISGFIDSVGRTHDLIHEGTSGVALRQIDLDRRVTPYTRYGDMFVYFCIAWFFVVTAFVVLRLMLRRWRASSWG